MRWSAPRPVPADMVAAILAAVFRVGEAFRAAAVFPGEVGLRAAAAPRGAGDEYLKRGSGSHHAGDPRGGSKNVGRDRLRTGGDLSAGDGVAGLYRCGDLACAPLASHRIHRDDGLPHSVVASYRLFGPLDVALPAARACRADAA